MSEPSPSRDGTQGSTADSCRSPDGRRPYSHQHGRRRPLRSGAGNGVEALVFRYARVQMSAPPGLRDLSLDLSASPGLALAGTPQPLPAYYGRGPPEPNPSCVAVTLNDASNFTVTLVPSAFVRWAS